MKLIVSIFIRAGDADSGKHQEQYRVRRKQSHRPDKGFCSIKIITLLFRVGT